MRKLVAAFAKYLQLGERVFPRLSTGSVGNMVNFQGRVWIPALSAFEIRQKHRLDPLPLPPRVAEFLQVTSTRKAWKLRLRMS